MTLPSVDVENTSEPAKYTRKQLYTSHIVIVLSNFIIIIIGNFFLLFSLFNIGIYIYGKVISLVMVSWVQFCFSFIFERSIKYSCSIFHIFLP